MAGIIIGAYGFQRSGKTLLAYMIAEGYRKKGCKVYTNMNTSNFINIKSLNDIPFDYKPKVLLLDEVYYFLDSRTWKNNTESSIFFNTIGKQNILLILTAISPDMIEKRLREQHNYMYLVKSDKDNIYYKMIDIQRRKSKIFTLRKSEELFKKLNYDTKQVPDFIDINIKDFNKKVSINKNDKDIKKVNEL